MLFSALSIKFRAEIILMYMLDVSVQLRTGEAIQNYVELFISEV